MFNDQAFSNPLSLACSNFLWAGPGAGGYVDNLDLVVETRCATETCIVRCGLP